MKKEDLANILAIEAKKKRAAEIENQMARPDFWADQQKASKLSQEFFYLKNLIDRFEKAETEEDMSDLEEEALFSGELDRSNAILSVHAGAGGTEAQDWAEMLLRMFLRFSEREGYKPVVLDKSEGEEVGVKSASVKIEGINAYGKLKGEAGVHRLVRISPYDADKARHTSFALVEVIPEFEEIGDIEIPEKDLKIDVFRSSGHGGQSVNTTDSAVRVTHLPSKISVSVQNERSQLQNRETALKILKMKLKKLEIDKKQEKERELKGSHTSAEWGNQIRSYVLQPYTQVKDHRTGYEESDPAAVLDGKLDGFTNSFLKSKLEKE
ncbi:MAG: peptide chain release factor 2 [Candidatus Berkelbacteria bacterium]|nr:peptide chain release factor 2 [Candidatus Berkelbacteria bacterium]